GVYGLGAVWATCVASIVLAWLQGGGGWVQRAAPAAGVLALLLGMATTDVPSFTQPHGQPLDVTLLQGNVPQDEKFIPDHQVPMLIWHGRELVHAKGTLVVAPETAIPLLPFQLPPD